MSRQCRSIPSTPTSAQAPPPWTCPGRSFWAATLVVNYKSGTVEEALARFGEVDVWWESLREPNLERAIGHLAMRGRIILIAGRDAKPVFPVGPFYTRDAKVCGFAMFNAPAD